MTDTLVPVELVDRQLAASRSGLDGLATIIDGQRSIAAAAVQLPLLSLVAAAHLTRSVITTVLAVTDRAATSSTESLERLNASLAVTDGREVSERSRLSTAS